MKELSKETLLKMLEVAFKDKDEREHYGFFGWLDYLKRVVELNELAEKVRVENKNETN